MGKHKHHIIPKHAGGTDDPENLIELTVEEHAEAHRKLYEEDGRWQDLVAWKALSGQITTDEARREATRRTWTGRKHTDEARKNIREGLAKANIIRGPRDDETKSKISNSLKGHKVSDSTRKLWKEQRTGRIVSESTKRKISHANKGKLLSEEHKEKLRKPKTKEHIQKIADANRGKVRTEEQRVKNRLARLGKKDSEETKQKKRDALKGRKITWSLNATTTEANEKRSKSMTGKPKPKLQCPHCGKEGGAPQMNQWHFNNCKSKP
jgi:hypothetical protein